MITPINNFLTSPLLVNLSQNTAQRVSCETGLKAIGRPSFILIDKDLDPKAKKYAATKEGLYQIICLGVYLAIIPTVFKQGTFALAKKLIFKNTKGFEKFKNSSEYLSYRKLASLDKTERLQNKKLEKFKNKTELYNALTTQEKPEKYDVLYGATETGSYFGSLLGLAILAPEVSHHLIHPIMRFLKLERKPSNSDNIEITKNK